MFSLHSFFLQLYLNCSKYAAFPQYEEADYVQTVTPNGAGTSKGFLGYMFWAAGRPSARNVSTIPPDDTCEDGMGVGAAYFDIPLPIGELPTD